MTVRLLPVAIMLAALAAWVPWASHNQAPQPGSGAWTAMPMRLEVGQDGRPSVIWLDGQRSSCGPPP